MPLACCVAIILRRLFTRRDSRVDALVAAVALAAMPWLHVRAWPVVLCLLAGALLTWRSVFVRASLVGIPAASTAGYWVLLYSIYGKFVISPVSLQPGIHLVRSQLGVTQIVAGLESLFVDPVAGLLPNAPIWLLALGALFLLARRSVAGAATTTAVVAYALFVGASSVLGTGPGTAPPGRFAVVLVPLLAPGLALAWERTAGAWWSELRWPLVAWTAVCAFVGQAARSASYPPGIVLWLVGLFGDRIPAFAVGAMPWVLLVVTIVLLGAVVLGLLASPRRGARASPPTPMQPTEPTEPAH